MIQLLLHTFDLPLKNTFTISRRSFNRQETLLVELRDPEGRSGFGEATHNPYYANTEIDLMKARLEELRPVIENFPLQEAEGFWKAMQPRLADCPFALCALDVAAQDLCARRVALPLYRHWGLEWKNVPFSSLTLSIDPLEVMIQRMQEKPWPVYKIKLGRENDLEIVGALRQHTDAAFRVDVNGAWSVEEAIEKSQALAKLGVEFIEQPLPAEDWNGMKKVFLQSALPLFADEACRTEADIETCVGHFHGINIKLMKCGGLTPALRMIRKARDYSLQVMVGCMTESTVGISAIAHLLPLIDHVDMDGALFLEKDVARGVVVGPEGVTFINEVGTGVELVLS